jgi:hypothetical protein
MIILDIKGWGGEYEDSYVENGEGGIDFYKNNYNEFLEYTVEIMMKMKMNF